ncbi:MAG: BON domain-containing protein, partial [Pseudomonadota bacterium]
MRFMLVMVTSLLLTACSTGLLTGGDYYKDQQRTDGVATADATVTDQVRRRLTDDAALSRYQIGVTTYKGRVTLTGSVVDFRDRNRAGDIAKAVAGART